MHRVPAGVAQSAEQPSCKRATEGHLSCGLIERLAGFGTYSARGIPSRGGPGKTVIEAVIVHPAPRGIVGLRLHPRGPTLRGAPPTRFPTMLTGVHRYARPSANWADA